jgi:hypothetical protein
MPTEDDLFEPAQPREDGPPREGPGFRVTLIRVMIVQVVALLLLWALQAHYHMGP